MFNKKPKTIILFLALLSLILLPLIGLAYWFNTNHKQKSNSNLEIKEKDSTNLNQEYMLNTELDGFKFSYSEMAGTIFYTGNVFLNNGCQSIESHRLTLKSTENVKSPSFVLQVNIIDPSLSGQMCTQLVREVKIEGELEFKFSPDFDEQKFNPDIFTIQRNISPKNN
jgi:hypothetical protein